MKYIDTFILLLFFLVVSKAFATEPKGLSDDSQLSSWRLGFIARIYGKWKNMKRDMASFGFHNAPPILTPPPNPPSRRASNTTHLPYTPQILTPPQNPPSRRASNTTDLPYTPQILTPPPNLPSRRARNTTGLPYTPQILTPPSNPPSRRAGNTTSLVQPRDNTAPSPTPSKNPENTSSLAYTPQILTTPPNPPSKHPDLLALPGNPPSRRAPSQHCLDYARTFCLAECGPASNTIDAQISLLCDNGEKCCEEKTTNAPKCEGVGLQCMDAGQCAEKGKIVAGFADCEHPTQKCCELQERCEGEFYKCVPEGQCSGKGKVVSGFAGCDDANSQCCELEGCVLYEMNGSCKEKCGKDEMSEEGYKCEVLGGTCCFAKEY